MSLNKLDFIKEDCILGFELLTRVSPICIDTQSITFKYTINGGIVSCPLSYESRPKCKMPSKKSTLNHVPLAELSKMERCVAYVEMHKNKALSDISTKLEKHYTSESPKGF